MQAEMYTEHQCIGSSVTPLASDCSATDVLTKAEQRGKSSLFLQKLFPFFSITRGMAIPLGEEISRVLKKSFWINELSVHMYHQYYFPHWEQGTIVIHK